MCAGDFGPDKTEIAVNAPTISTFRHSLPNDSV